MLEGDHRDPSVLGGGSAAPEVVGPLGGVVVAEYFDVGQSRSVPWDRRDNAVALVISRSEPGWDAVVVGGEHGAGSETSSRWCSAFETTVYGSGFRNSAVGSTQNRHTRC
jgi:hypothetical protein